MAISASTRTSVAKLEREAIDRALARADAYRVLAALFHDPDDPAGAPEPDLSALRSASRALSVSGGEPWRALRPLADRPTRAAEHRRIFGHVVAHGCPPYETEYGRRHLFGQSQELADLRGFYEAFGFRPRPGAERPDHLTTELEFLAMLSLKEAITRATGQADRTSVCEAAAARFLEDHLGRWMAALAGRVAARAPGSGLAAATSLAAALVAAHAASLGVEPVMLDPDDLIEPDEGPDGFTFSCGVDAEAGDLAPPDVRS
jgi:TorA maturation chaperone TorD